MNDDASKSTAFLDRYELRIIFMLVLVLALMALWRWTSPMTPSWAGIDIPHPLTASMSSGQASDAASTYWHSLVLLAAVGLGGMAILQSSLGLGGVAVGLLAWSLMTSNGYQHFRSPAENQLIASLRAGDTSLTRQLTRNLPDQDQPALDYVMAQASVIKPRIDAEARSHMRSFLAAQDEGRLTFQPAPQAQAQIEKAALGNVRSRDATLHLMRAEEQQSLRSSIVLGALIALAAIIASIARDALKDRQRSSTGRGLLRDSKT